MARWGHRVQGTSLGLFARDGDGRLLASCGLERLQLEAATSNPGSNEVARQLGFVHEGTLRRAAVDRAPDGPPERRFDMNVWGLLPEELT